MIPKTLAEWTLDRLRVLLDSQYREAESFDYKSMLPHPNDEDGKRRLRDACAAFANSTGGFIVFGVADDLRLPTDQRLVGLPTNVDFPTQFGNFPPQCNPSVRWDFLNPAIRLENGNWIHVAWIPQSFNAPHSVGKPDEGLLFPKRTNRGTDYMSYEEVRMSFLGYYEKRLKLQLLDAELVAVIDNAERSRIDADKVASHYSLFTFEPRLIEIVISETYALTAGRPELLAALQRLRKALNVANNKMQVFFSQVALPLSDMPGVYRQHNEHMATLCGQIIELAKQSRSLLQPLLAS